MDEKGFMMGKTNKHSVVVPLWQAEAIGQTGSLKERVVGCREWVTLIATICADGTALKSAPSLRAGAAL